MNLPNRTHANKRLLETELSGAIRTLRLGSGLDAFTERYRPAVCPAAGSKAKEGRIRRGCDEPTNGSYVDSRHWPTYT